MTIQLTDSPAYGEASPRLSVLIPFFHDDPLDLVQQLDQEASTLAGQVELVLLDDGTRDPRLTAVLNTLICNARLPVRLVTLSQNEGRSLGRNRLAAQARGQHFLFLDSDMKPDRPDFLQAWTEIVRDGEADVAFGGFSLLQAPDNAAFSVHRAMALRSDCLDASQRALQPEKYVFTSNLLTSREVFEAQAFDPDFSGWGWEDVEWAMRVSRLYPVRHFDIPATHMGLDTADDLARKYEQSVPNFARILALHPDFVTAYPSYRAARLLSRIPLRGLLRASLRVLFRARILPAEWRAFSLRLYRTALYAEVV